MATRRESTDTDTSDDIDESQFSTDTAQTQPFSTVLFNTFDILGYHDTISASELKNLRQQLQLSSPTLDRPSSTISQSSSESFLASTSNQYPQSKIYLDLDDKSYYVLLADDPQPASTILTDLDDTAVKESHNSVENIGNLSNNQDHHGEDMVLYPARKKSRGAPLALDADNSINPNCFPRHDQSTSQLQLPDGWKELKSKYPNYASIFLKCNQCNKPHCHCARVGVCNQRCPNRAEVAKLYKDGAKGPHISHCPICLRIGKGKGKGISWRRGISDSIELFSCTSCDAFYRSWNDPTELKLMNEMKCDSFRKGECLTYWNLSEEGWVSRCKWCRMRLMQLLGFRMPKMLDGYIKYLAGEYDAFNAESAGFNLMKILETSGGDKWNIHSESMPFSKPV